MLAGVYAVVRPSVTRRYCVKSQNTELRKIVRAWRSLHDSAGTLVFDAKNIGEFRPGHPLRQRQMQVG